MDKLGKGKVASKFFQGCTDTLNEFLQESDLPEYLKKLASKSRNNVDEAIDEYFVLNNMDKKFEEIKPSAIEATPRPDAGSEPKEKKPEAIKTEKVEGSPMAGRYE